MPGAPPLPLELVLEIMLYVYMEARGKPHRVFQKFSLVCKLWKTYAQRLLYRDIRLHSTQAVYGFLKATCFEEGNLSKEHLGHSVRSLEITLMSKEMISLLPFVLRHCPKLYEFSAIIYNPINIEKIKNAPIPTQSMTTAATDAGFNSISSIPYKEIPIPIVQAIRINSSSHIPDLVQPFLSLWPHLSHLVLTGYALLELAPFILTGPRVPQKRIPNLKLYELQCTRATGGRIETSLFRNLLTGSIGILKILDLSGLEYSTIEGLSEFFTDHGPYLRSLRLPILPVSTQLPFLQYCTELEEIIVYSYPFNGIKDNIPVEKIVHASFVRQSSQALQTLNPMIRWLRTMKQLKVFTWTTCRGGGCDHARDTAKLAKVCTEMNVRLRSTEVVSVDAKPEELIEPLSFPRDELITPVWR